MFSRGKWAAFWKLRRLAYQAILAVYMGKFLRKISVEKWSVLKRFRINNFSFLLNIHTPSLEMIWGDNLEILGFVKFVILKLFAGELFVFFEFWTKEDQLFSFCFEPEGL